MTWMILIGALAAVSVLLLWRSATRFLRDLASAEWTVSIDEPIVLGMSDPAQACSCDHCPVVFDRSQIVFVERGDKPRELAIDVLLDSSEPRSPARAAAFIVEVPDVRSARNARQALKRWSDGRAVRIGLLPTANTNYVDFIADDDRRRFVLIGGAST